MQHLSALFSVAVIWGFRGERHNLLAHAGRECRTTTAERPGESSPEHVAAGGHGPHEPDDADNLAAALATLTELEARVIHLHYHGIDGEALTFAAIGREVGRDRRGVSDIHARAMARLREFFGVEWMI